MTTSAPACGQCQKPVENAFDFTMAFQPIVDCETRTVYSYEALVRGVNGEGAGVVLSKVNDDNRYWFDQGCRTKAIELAASLGVSCRLNINFLPNAVYQPENCLRSTLDAAARFGFPTERINFELTEAEQLDDHDHLRNIISEYRRLGFETAIDDFGAGYSGLNMLAQFQPDALKLDMALIRNLQQDRVKQAIVRGILGVARELEIRIIAEGVETREELGALRDMGIHFIQGYLFAKPGFESLPEPDWSVL